MYYLYYVSAMLKIVLYLEFRLSKEEYKQLLGNIHEVLEVHQRLLSNLETAMTQDCASRVGNLFLTLAPKLKSIHMTYCGNHPRAVCTLDRYRCARRQKLFITCLHTKEN